MYDKANLVNLHRSYSPETPYSVKIDNFFVPSDLEIWQMTMKTIGHLFYAISSFVHHFVAIWEFKLELQSGNAQFGSKSVIFVPCDLEIWWMTLKNKRAPLLYYFKLCASFHRHWWIQTGVTVRKRPNWDKICFDLCDLDLWPLTMTFCVDIILVNGNNSWNFHDDPDDRNVVKKVSQKDGQTDGLKCS